MQPEVQILKSTFAIFGLYPLEETESGAQRLYSRFLNAAILGLAAGIGAQAVYAHCSTDSAILPMTYFLCSLFGVAKRWTILRCKGHFRRLLRDFQHRHAYPDERHFRPARYPPASIRRIHAVVRLLLANLFFFAYASPFLSVTLGKSLDYTQVIYPFYIPWTIADFRTYMLTYSVQAVLLASALIGIYSYTILIVFVAINFQMEFDKIGQAVGTLETRVNDQIQNGAPSWHEGTRGYFAGRRRSPEYEKLFNSNLRECILHFGHLRENFKIFGRWYNSFFSVELIESITTICLLFFCAIKDEKLLQELYDTHWYEQRKSTMKMILLFQGQIRQPFSFNGLKQFPASFRTFTRVSRISYSYLNVLLNS